MHTELLRRMIVIGHGITGLTYGQVIRREGFGGELLIVDQESHAPYSPSVLSKGLIGETPGRLEPLPGLLAGSFEDAEVITGHGATGLDLNRRAVLLDDGRVVGFDGLMIASGASPRWNGP